MSYLVLARKHRPQDFNALIGQEHIVTVLKKAIETNRVAHAYLFCGPRGVGKTSCARILAKCLNDENGPTTQPNHDSSICRDIAKGTSFDVLEIDGASNRGIDEIRALRENVKFAPSYGRYKIYIVDEVHMLTAEAFNALLKTLEEPPEHVKFIFATTDPNKLPVTIISRCQRFDFKRISLEVIVGTLADVAKKEKFKIEEDALYAVAKAAQGSLRDALSIFDQISALSEQKIKAEDVFLMLGIVETDLLFSLVDAVGEKNCPESLRILEVIAGKGKDIRQLLKDLTEHFRHLMVIKIGGKSLGRLVDYPVAIKEMFLKQTQSFTLKEILTALDTLIETQNTARIIENIRMSLEITIAKLTFTEDTGLPAKVSLPRSSVKPAQRPSSSAPVRRSSRIFKNKKGEIPIAGTDDEGKNEPSREYAESDDLGDNSVAEIVNAGGMVDINRVRRGWDALTYAVSREKMSLATFLQEGFPLAVINNTINIGFPKNCSLHKESLEAKDNILIVERIFSEKLGEKVFVKYAISDEHAPLEEEGAVQSALNTFGGKIISRWHDET